MCNEWLHVCTRKKIQEIDLKSEVSNILSDKPEKTKDNNYINSLYTSFSGNERETIKMAHITDMHFDFDYKVGAKAICKDKATGCCREETGMAGPGELGAREWGEFACDAP